MGCCIIGQLVALDRIALLIIVVGCAKIEGPMGPAFADPSRAPPAVGGEVFRHYIAR